MKYKKKYEFTCTIYVGKSVCISFMLRALDGRILRKPSIYRFFLFFIQVI